MALSEARFVRFVAVGLLAVAAVACGGGESATQELGGSTSVAGSEPAGSTAAPSTSVDVGPADGIGVAETVAPDPAALLVDESGALVSGDQVLVILAGGAGREVADAAAVAAGGEVVGQVEVANLWQIQIPTTDLAGLDAALAAAGAVDGVELAFPNGTVTTDEEIWGTPVSPLDDPVYTGPAGDGYRMIGVEQAWAYLRGSGLPLSPVQVGIVDTGVWTGTDEFDADGVTVSETGPGTGIRADPEDVRVKQPDGTWAVTGSNPGGGHGTGVATIVGADPNNGGATGIAAPLDDLTVTTTNAFAPPYGLANFSEVPADVTDDAQVVYPDGTAFTAGAFQAIAEQIRNGARVINMSWGCTNCDSGSATAYRLFFEQMAARHPDVLFVASAGNDGQSVDGSRRYPSGLNLPNMITVGNVNNDGTTAGTGTNTASANFEVTLAAPGHQAVQGVDANGTIIDNTYVYPGGVTYGGGTSMAAPQVTAAAALLKALDPTLTAAQLKQLLVDSARTTITRPDGTQQAIDAGVGGRVLAVDEAVRHLIAAKLGVSIDDPAVSPDTLTGLGTIDAVARSGAGDDWTVTGYVDACHPTCTQVTIELQGQGAIGGTTTQAVAAAPGEATWSVTLPDYPATIIVRRTDNGAASRILVERTTLDGRWTGTITYESVEPPAGFTYDVSGIVGSVITAELDIAMGDGGSGTVVLSTSGTIMGQEVGGVRNGSVAVDGDRVQMSIDFEGHIELVGTVSRAAGTPTMTGTWSGVILGFSYAGSWEATQAA